MSALDALLGGVKQVAVAASLVAIPANVTPPSILNFASGANVAYNATTGSYDVTVTATPAVTGTGFSHVSAGVFDAAARAVNLATIDVTGILPFANGGVGPFGSNGNILQMVAGAPAWVSDPGAGFGTAGQFLVTNAAATSSAWASLSGDVSGSAATPGAVSVLQVAAATGNWNWASTVAAPSITQSSESSATKGADILVQPQQSTQATNFGGGNVQVNLQVPGGSGVEAYFGIQRAGVEVFSLGPYPGSGANYAGIWIGANSGASAGANNFTLLGADNGSATYLNAPNSGGTVFISCANAAVVTVTSATLSTATTSLLFSQPTIAPVIQQTVVPGTGANAGQVFSLIAQAGQQQSGATANNNGGSIAINSGAPGTGGSGAAGLPGNILLNTPTAATTGFTIFQSGGTNVAWVGPYNNTTTEASIWFVNSPTLSNFSFLGTSTATWLNAPSGGTVYTAINGTQVGLWTAAGFQIGSAASFAGGTANMLGIANATGSPGSSNPTGGIAAWASGANALNLIGSAGLAVVLGLTATPTLNPAAQTVSATAGEAFTVAGGAGGATSSVGGALNLSGGTPGSGGTTSAVNLQTAGVTTMTVDDGGWGPIAVSWLITTTTNNSLIQSQWKFPIIDLSTVTLTGATSITFPSLSRVWFVDISKVTLGGGSLTFKCGSATSAAITIATTSQLVMVRCFASGTAISINL